MQCLHQWRKQQLQWQNMEGSSEGRCRWTKKQDQQLRAVGCSPLSIFIFQHTLHLIQLNENRVKILLSLFRTTCKYQRMAGSVQCFLLSLHDYANERLIVAD